MQEICSVYRRQRVSVDFWPVLLCSCLRPSRPNATFRMLSLVITLTDIPLNRYDYHPILVGLPSDQLHFFSTFPNPKDTSSESFSSTKTCQISSVRLLSTCQPFTQPMLSHLSIHWLTTLTSSCLSSLSLTNTQVSSSQPCHTMSRLISFLTNYSLGTFTPTRRLDLLVDLLDSSFPTVLSQGICFFLDLPLLSHNFLVLAS